MYDRAVKPPTTYVKVQNLTHLIDEASLLAIHRKDGWQEG